MYDHNHERRIPFLLSTTERTFIEDLATRAGEAGLRAGYFSPDAVADIRIIADPLGDPNEPICLCSGTGKLLAEAVTLGFRLTPLEDRAAVAKTADVLMARMVVANADSAESTDQQDEHVLRNIYRAGLGLPVYSESLLSDQTAIAAREAQMLASLLDLKVQVGQYTDGNSIAGPLEEQFLRGEQPNINFLDRSTGGRPAQVGNIRIVDAATFFATFAISFLIDGERVVREGIADATGLRATFIELGRARRAALAAPAN